MFHVKKLPSINSIGKMGIYFDWINYVPTCSMHGLLTKKAHKRGLMGHFGTIKTLDVLSEYFFWLHIKHDVKRFCEKWIACKQNLKAWEK